MSKKKRKGIPFCRDYPYTKRRPENFEVVDALIVDKHHIAKNTQVMYTHDHWIDVNSDSYTVYRNYQVVMWKSQSS